jgi:hypothetical protein
MHPTIISTVSWPDLLINTSLGVKVERLPAEIFKLNGMHAEGRFFVPVIGGETEKLDWSEKEKTTGEAPETFHNSVQRSLLTRMLNLIFSSLLHSPAGFVTLSLVW